ncbi:MAG: hypothetical protein HYX52_00085 [Chloroflexi bacterium]|nr:hypothetical protein [Chloroflexota bacterium]
MRDLLLFAVALLLTLGAFFTADQWARGRQLDSAGLNVRGYRGALLGAKQPNALRYVLLGDSVAFGYGVRETETLSTRLGESLTRLLNRPVNVANLAFNGESAVCYPSTLDLYAGLEPDGVVIYAARTDSTTEAAVRDPATCARNQAPLSRWTGYQPALPQAIREKYFQLRYGTIDAGYAEQERRVPRIDSSQSAPRIATSLEVEAVYRARLGDLISAQLLRGRQVVLVRGFQRDEEPVIDSIRERFQESSAFVYVDLRGQIDPSDPAESFDGVHLTAFGSAKAAGVIASSLSAMLAGA